MRYIRPKLYIADNLSFEEIGQIINYISLQKNILAIEFTGVETNDE